jgi:hypothetical protein
MQWRQEWLNLLDVMEVDGDFAQRRPHGAAEVIWTRELLVNAAPNILDGFCELLVGTHGSAAAIAAQRLRHSKPTGKRGPWAGFNLNTPDDGAWLYLEVRNVWSRAPRIRVWHWHWPERRVRKEVRLAYDRMPDRSGLRLLKDGAVFDRPCPARSADRSDVADEILRRLEGLVTAGVFEPDLRYQNKHYRPQ